jgi:hypothetical protein
MTLCVGVPGFFWSRFNTYNNHCMLFKSSQIFCPYIWRIFQAYPSLHPCVYCSCNFARFSPRFFKFRGLLVSRKQILYFISVSNNLRQRYPLPLFGFGSIYVYCRLSTLTTGMHIYYAIPPVSPSRWWQVRFLYCFSQFKNNIYWRLFSI